MNVTKLIERTEIYELFDTEIGRCGIAWTAKGISRVQLPEQSVTALRARLESTGAQAVKAGMDRPRFVDHAIAKLQKHLRGKIQEFDDVPLDLRHVPPFHQKVYRALQKIEPGAVTTYGALAEMAGSPGASRAVGQAMAKNPLTLLVPCHRVIGSAGKLGGFSAYGGGMTKTRLLGLEGTHIGTKQDARY